MERYFESKKNALSLRTALLTIQQNEHLRTDEMVNESSFGILRYFYYIHQGVDLVNLVSIDKNSIDAILSKITFHREKRDQIDSLLAEINEMFVFALRKSVVDFALQDLTDTAAAAASSTRVTPVVKIARRRYRFEETKSKIFENLFAVHPIVVKISQIWSLQYGNLRIINIEELSKLESIDLNVFKDWLSSQIDYCKSILLEKWIPFVFKVVLRAVERDFHATKKSKLSRFYDCLSTLMTLQLQNMYLQTMNEYTDFICDPLRKATFQVRVLYKNKKIMFNPAYKEFTSIITKVYSDMMNAINNCIPRIETKLYPQNWQIDDIFLKPFILAEVVRECQNRVEETLQDEWIGPELKIQDFDEYICLINGQSKIQVNKFLCENRPLEMFKDKVSYYHELGVEISLSCARVVTIGLFDVHREHFITILVNKSQTTKDRFLSNIMDTYRDACKRLTDEFQTIKDYLLKAPANTAELVEKKQFNLNLGTKVLFDMEERLRVTMRNILFCSDYVPLSSWQIKQNTATFLCYRRISDILEENRNIIEEKTVVFQNLLQEKIALFRKDLQKYRKQVEEFRNYGEASELPKLLKKSHALYNKFQLAAERIEQYNAEEIAFGWMRTNYAEKDELVANLLPYKKLYDTCVNYKNKHRIWTEAKIGAYMPQDIENDVLTYHHYIVELCDEFESIAAPFALTNSIKQEVENFLKRMPIVKTLGNPRLKDRHWEKISEIVGFPLHADDDLTLAKILDFGLDEYAPKFDTISDAATRENELEMKMNEMIAEWKDMKFEMQPYRDTGAFILTNAQHIQTLLDDHIVKTQTMKNSSYIKPFECTIRSWEDKLMSLQQIMDLWLSIQDMWLFVEPIFTLGDIKQLVQEGSKRFNVVDKIWKEITKLTSQNTSVLAVLEVDKFIERLHKCVTLLDRIHDGFTTYLQTKRTSFTRFFFLADREILQIISNAGDPRRVERFVRKCFDGVAKVRFTSDLQVLALVSQTEQELRLCEPVDTVCHRGDVDKWFSNVEKTMKNTIIQNLKSALCQSDGGEDGLTATDSTAQQQIVCVVNRIATASKIEKNLRDTVQLEKYLRDELDVQIENTINSLCSHDVHELQTNIRYNLVSLLVQQMEMREHARRLLDTCDYSVREAEFLNLIRCRVQDNGVYFSIHDCTIEYGYEFIGNYTPMVVTPAVDRCYKSIFASIKCNYGISLTGSDGIGKTETLKNFAKLVARSYVIFDCNRSRTFESGLIENLFKGAVTSDTWLCFDRADALRERTLQMVEHYVLKIQQAILLNEQRVRISDTWLKFDRRKCVLFATTANAVRRHHDHNSSYHRCDNLSPFLRTIYRPVVLAPDEQDNEKFLQTKLQILGIEKYVELANKLNAVMKIAGVLVQRDASWYFHNGVRVFASILKMVEIEKRLYRNVNDESLISHCVTIFCQSTYHPRDWHLFARIARYVFGATCTLHLPNSDDDDDDDDNVNESIREACMANNYVVDERITQKITHLVRIIDNTTGVMLVGRAATGKSSILNILASTLTSLERNNYSNESTAKPKMVYINPKSMTLDQLYGHRDQNTNRWIDGVLTSSYRAYGDDDGDGDDNLNRADDGAATDARKWLILDGAADNWWMENLNTVLDDTKTLRLNTGETIPLSRRTNIFFETASLDNVSPSTISRCFVSYFDDDFVRWQYLIDSWLNNGAFTQRLVRIGAGLSSVDHDQQTNHIRRLARRYFRLLFDYFDSIGDAGFTYTVMKNHIIESFCNIFDCHADEFVDRISGDGNTGDTDAADQHTRAARIDIQSVLEGIFFFACIWSAGALLNKAYRENFDILFRALLSDEFPVDVRKRLNLADELCEAEHAAAVELRVRAHNLLPDCGTVFDYRYDIIQGKGKWKLWTDSVGDGSAWFNCSIPRDIQFGDIVVPTKVTLRNHYLLSLLASRGKSFMLVGHTASGKSVDITNFFNTKPNDEKIEYKTKAIFYNFSTRTSANIVQNFVLSKLEKRKKGVFGPPLGMRYVFFFDDMSAVTRATQHSSSAVELLRYSIEHNRWYNLADSKPIQLIDIQLVCAFTTTGANSAQTTLLCPRFTRHFNIFSNDEFDDETLKSIYSKIMLWHLDTRGFSKEFDPCIEQIVDATVEMHNRIGKCLLPVPDKPHYVFNLRDFSKTIQGVVLSVPEAIEDLLSMKRLWVHEVMRVYHDRISDENDSRCLIDTIKQVCASKLNIDSHRLVELVATEDEIKKVGEREDEFKNVIFCDFINPKADVRNYAQVQDVEALQSIVEGFLIEYNNVNKKQMNLLLFPYAIEHVARICRVLKQRQGHAVLLGHHACGKRSLTKLAVHICEYECFEIDLTGQFDRFQYWREQIKNILFTVFTDQHSAILLTNIHDLSDAILEDISNLLQNAVIADLFNNDERKEIRENIAALSNQRDKMGDEKGDGHDADAETIFNARVKRQIHVVLVFGSSMREFEKCVEKFPCLMKCTTMDVFQPWSDEQRTMLARKLLADAKCESNDLCSAIDLCQRLHDDAKHVGEETPMRLPFTHKSFIRLVTTFRHLYTSEFEMLTRKKQTLDDGLAQLEYLKQQTPKLHNEYEALTPIIDETRDRIEKLTNEIEAEKQIETEAEIAANGARSTAKKMEKKFNALKEKYDDELKRMADNYESVVGVLQSLSSNDMAALKSIKNPAKCLRLVAEGIAHLKEDMKAEKVHEGAAKTTEDYWKPMLKAIGEGKFVESLCNRKISDVSSRAMYLLEERILSNDEFEGAKIKSYSVAAEALYKWIMVVYEYNRWTKIDSDAKIELNRVEHEFADARCAVNEQQKCLEDSATKRKCLEKNAQRVNDQLQRLMGEQAKCANKKRRAAKLIDLVCGRKARWRDDERSIERKLQTVMGDTLLCAAILTYLTSLNEPNRRKMTNKWWSLITNTNTNGGPSLRCRTDFAIHNVLLSDVQIERENSMNARRDDFFYDNTAIIRNYVHYPLVIDAEGLINDWIKDALKEKNLLVLNAQRDDYLRNLQNAVASGNVVLLENIGQSVDAILYNLFDAACEISKGSSCAQRNNNNNNNNNNIKMGNNTVVVNDEFALLMVSEAVHANYSVELLEKLTIVRCDASESSVENFLLEKMVAHDNHSLAEQRSLLTSRMLTMKKAIIESELNIIESLTARANTNVKANANNEQEEGSCSGSDGDGDSILHDDDTVNVVETNVLLVDKNDEKLVETCMRLDAINETIRQFYQPIAKHLAALFEICARLRRLNGAYQFSLKWFDGVIASVTANTNTNTNTTTTTTTSTGANANEKPSSSLVAVPQKSRLHYEMLIESLTNKFYTSVIRWLDEKDIPIFNYLWCVNDAMKREKMPLQLEQQLTLFAQCLQDDARLLALGAGRNRCATETTNSIRQRVEHSKDMLRERLASSDQTSYQASPHDGDQKTVPHHFREFLLDYCDNSDQIVDHVRKLTYLELPNEKRTRVVHTKVSTDFTSIYKETNCRSAIAVVVLDQCDPINEIFALAAHLGINSEKCTILNGTATEAAASTNSNSECNSNWRTNAVKLIDDAKSTGCWIIIRNLSANNLAKCSSWLREILTKLTVAESNAAARSAASQSAAAAISVHPDFRLWLVLDGRITYRNDERILQNAFLIMYRSHVDRIDTNESCESFRNRWSSFFKNVRDELKSRSSLHNGNGDVFRFDAAYEESLFEYLYSFHATLRDMALVRPSKCERCCNLINAVDFQIAYYLICEFLAKYDLVRACNVSANKIATILRSILHVVYDAKMMDQHDRRIMVILLRLYCSEQYLIKIIGDSSRDFQPSIKQLQIIRQEISNFKRDKQTASLVEKLSSVHSAPSANGDEYDNSERQTFCCVKDVQNVVNSIPAVVEYNEYVDELGEGDIFVRRAVSSEIKYFNAMITELRDTCSRSIESLDGRCVLTNEIASFLHGLQNGRIVFNERIGGNRICCSTVENQVPLNTWLRSMANKGEFLQKLAKNDKLLAAIDLSSLQYSKMFLISKTLQFYVSRCLPIDEIDFDSFLIIDCNSHIENKLTIFVDGVYVENATWDHENQLPVIDRPGSDDHVLTIRIATTTKDENLKNEHSYVCPIYKIFPQDVESTHTMQNILNFFIDSPSCDCELLDEWIIRRVKLIIKSCE